jgi:rhodanese-related sulfurtransferase
MSPASGVQTIPPAELAGRDGYDLIDVRTPIEYEEVHARSARLVPLDRLDPKAVMAARRGPAEEPLFVICKSGGRSAKAVQKFQAAGFDNVISVAGGTSAWEKAGLPVARGESNVISLERQVRIAAGLLVIIGVALGYLLHPALFAMAGFVGAGLVFAGVTNTCGMGMMLARMPWNQGRCEGSSCSR